MSSKNYLCDVGVFLSFHLHFTLSSLNSEASMRQLSCQFRGIQSPGFCVSGPTVKTTTINLRSHGDVSVDVMAFFGRNPGVLVVRNKNAFLCGYRHDPVRRKLEVYGLQARVHPRPWPVCEVVSACIQADLTHISHRQ